jgi:p70 ribosomal S6 kinase
MAVRLHQRNFSVAWGEASLVETSLMAEEEEDVQDVEDVDGEADGGGEGVTTPTGISRLTVRRGSVEVEIVPAAQDPMEERLHDFDDPDDPLENNPLEHSPLPQHHVADDLLFCLENGMSDVPVETKNTDFELDSGVHRDDVASMDVNHQILLNKGKTNLDSFDIVSLIGKGAYGKVYLVKEKKSGDHFAMKVIKKVMVLQKNLIRHTNAERDVLVAVKHPFIVSLQYAFQTEQKLYLLMDYVPGGELFSRLNVENYFLESQAVFYAAEIVLVFEHLHSMDTIYRDLKPENILIQADGHICLTDFGLAKREVTDDQARTFCGTLHYMAPEMIDLEKPYGKPADWWSLGALIFEMLTGRPPFTASNNKDLQKKILTGKLVIPERLSLPAKSIIKAFLTRHVPKRLGSSGIEKIKKHKFFADINWKKLANKELPPPFVPELKDSEDISCFDTKFTQMDPSLSPHDVSVQLSHSMQENFKGFSFVREQ